ncbi:MAG TPA: ABC transporter ATP-binding protein [Saprospiraceae bacterium]|nr:ABC transporter ATP-binding protein [Saprospiraceae bacterium]
MQEIKKLWTYLKPYFGLVQLNILSNVLMAFFTVVSIPAIIPFLRVLFNLQEKVAVKPELSFSTSSILDYLNYSFSQIIDRYGSSQALIYACLGIILIFLLKNLFRYLSLFFLAPVRNGVVFDLRRSLFSKLISLPLGFFTDERKGDMLTRMSSDISEVEFSIMSMLESFFREPIIIAGSILFMFYVSPSLTLFVFALILFTGFIIGGISRALKKKSLQAQNLLGTLMSIVEESLGGLRIIKAFNAEKFQEDRFNRENNQYRRLMNRILWRRDLASPLSEFLGIVVVAVLMWYGSRQVFNQTIGPETFIAFLFAFFNVINPAKAFSTAYYNLQKGRAALQRIEYILQTENTIVENTHPRNINRFNTSVRYDQVYFRYHDQQPWVLDDISFTLHKGKTIALVGSSGSGKSTLADLLPRFYDINAGEIYLDDIPLKEYSIRDLRSLLGIVSQEAILFHDTIYNNIVFGKEGVTPEQVEQAARMANAHEFIMETEHGYQTVIGDRGTKLSGGQRQRITIARAFLSDPQILIFDEATSALDAESERLVQAAMETLLEDRTAIIIAHRLSTIQHVDEILVIKNGKIIERGNHQALSTQQGEYVKFMQLQAI